MRAGFTWRLEPGYKAQNDTKGDEHTMPKRGIGFLALLLLFCGGLLISQTLSNVALASKPDLPNDLVAYIENLHIENELLTKTVVQLLEQIEVLETELEKLQLRPGDLDQLVITWQVEHGKSVVLVAPPFHELDSFVEFKSINVSESQVRFDLGDEQRCLSLDEFDVVVAFYGSSTGFVEALKNAAQETYGSCTVFVNDQSYGAEEVLVLTNRILVIVLMSK